MGRNLCGTKSVWDESCQTSTWDEICLGRNLSIPSSIVDTKGALLKKKLEKERWQRLKILFRFEKY